MPDLPALLDAIRATPDDGARCQALASWYWDNGRDDEAVTVRTFWPILRDTLADGVSLEETLRQVARHAKLLGRRAREAEAQKPDAPTD